MNQTWAGDWRQRIVERVRGSGFESLTAFSDSAATSTFQEIASRLGKDVAPIQLAMLMRDEAVERGQLGRFARGALVRFLADYLPKGWQQGKEHEYERASAFADWIACLGEDYRAAGERVWKVFMSATNLTEGWKPSGADDDLLRGLFDRASFSASEVRTDLK